MLYSCWQDLRYAARRLRKTPSFTAAAILVLALGIGANSAVFSVLDTLVLRPPPYRDPLRLVVLGERSPYAEFGGTAPGNLLDYQRQLRSFEQLAASVGRSLTLTGRGLPMHLAGRVVTPSFFVLFQGAPLLGRTLDPALDRPGGRRAAVLSYRAWQRDFGGDRGVVGRSVLLDGEAFTVVGVMRPTYVAPQPADLWVSPRYTAPEPIGEARADVMEDRGNYNFLRPFGRLRRGVSLGQAAAEMRIVSGRLARQFPEADGGKLLWAMPLQEWLVGNVWIGLWTLLGAVGLILLIACANIANLLLARGSHGGHELAVRAAIGASRPRLMRLMLIESGLLGLCGGLCGLLLAVAGVRLMVRLGPADLPRLGELGVRHEMLLFCFAVSLATGLIAGLMPAWRLAHTNHADALKQGGRATTAGGKRLRQALVATEVALSVALLIGSALLLRSFSALLSVDPGFKSDRVMVAEISLPAARYSDARATAFFDEVLRRVRQIPGVTGAGLVSALPFSEEGVRGPLLLPDRPAPKAGDELETQKVVVSAGYFQAMGVPLLRGRDLLDSDVRGGEPVVVINQHLARYAWPHDDPLGKRLGWGGQLFKVVGIVGNVHQYRLEEGATFDTYIPYRQAESIRAMALAVRHDGDPLGLGTALRRAVMAVDKDQALAQIAPLRDMIAHPYRQRRFLTLVIGVLAMLSILLAAIGIYGVTAYAVSQRTKELGVRMALGADRRRLFGIVMGEAVAIAGIGILAGVAAAGLLVRLIRSQLFQVGSTDAVSYCAACLLALAAAAVAAFLPARRAMRTDPMAALRIE